MLFTFPLKVWVAMRLTPKRAGAYTGDSDVACPNNMDKMGWVVASPKNYKSTKVKIHQNKANIPLTKRLLVFPGRLKRDLLSFALVGTIH